jgi:hypothetical protein
MSPRQHIDDLFSGAYEDELSPIDEARFQSHIQKCAPCAEAYAEFRASVESLRELPKARMPHVVHLPSTPPIAELPRRPRIGLSWFNLELLRRFPATALAGGVVAVIIVIALVHGPGSPNSPNSTAGGASTVPANAPGAVAESACSQPATEVTGAPPPVDFGQATSVTAAGQPALHLVLATPSLLVTPGETVTVYAQLTVPETGLSAPGATPAPAAAISVRPCVSITVGSNPAGLPAAAGGNQDLGIPDAVPVAESPTTPQQSLVQFTVPAGLTPGTVLHVMATIPAAYGEAGSAPLTATLTLTTH